MVHELYTKPSFGESLEKLITDKSLSAVEKNNVALTLKEYKKATNFTEEFVIKKSMLTSETFHAWIKAREENDWSIYLPALEKLVVLKREEAKLLGNAEHPYDNMLDIYEPGMTVKKLDVIFKDVKENLLPLLKKCLDYPSQSHSFMSEKYDLDKQWDFGIYILESMGYDFTKGRQDKSTHPFTTSFGPEDVRITTRLKEDDFSYMLWSTIHEGGHALYEQGLPTEEYGLPSGSYMSLGIHESQSRLWENNVGRDFAFWEHHFPVMKGAYKEQLDGVTLQDFMRAINNIAPNLIRTEADELHYHFHVMIRYEIEKKLIEGSIEISELRDVWNDMYEEYLGLRPKDDNEGILQDIHWSHGSFGYFPTYSLGSFYAAQFYEQAKKDIYRLEEKLSHGDSSELLSWLRTAIHSKGHSMEAEELCKEITGSTLSLHPFINYIERKFSRLYE
jgi:carboxypeptidase Taq